MIEVMARLMLASAVFGALTNVIISAMIVMDKGYRDSPGLYSLFYSSANACVMTGAAIALGTLLAMMGAS